MKLVRHEDTIVKILLTVGLTLSAAFLLHTIYLLVDNYGASRLLREEARSFGELSREAGDALRLREEVAEDIETIEGHVLVSESARQDLLSRFIQEGDPIDASVFIGYLETYEEDPGLRVAPLTIAVEGSYPEILAYLNRIERMDYYFHLRSFSVSETEEGSQGLQGEIEGFVFMSRL